MADGLTATVFARSRSRALRLAWGGLAAVVVGLALAAVAPAVGIEALGGWMVVIGPVVGLVGVAKLVRLRRIGHVLAASPWAGRTASFRLWASTGPALVIHADGHGLEAVCSIIQNKLRPPVLEVGDRRPMWVAGDPTRWAVVAPVDRSNLVVARPPVLAWSTTRLRRAATSEPPVSRLLRPDDTRPLWLRLATTRGGVGLMVIFVALFGGAISIATLSMMSRNVVLGVGGAFLILTAPTRTWLQRRLAHRPTPVDETEARAALFLLMMPTLIVGIAFTGGGLVALLLHN